MITGVIRFLGVAIIQRFVGQGKGGVQAEHTVNHAGFILVGGLDKIDVFLNSGFHFIGTVSVRNLIAKAGTYAQLLGDISNCKEAVFNLAIAGVVIHHSGNTLLNTVDISIVCAVFIVFVCQVAVNGPPLAV
ncbi:hypothetical protein SDC9_179378 [bioreactor metagenome]|uniref:Uncharacterized protein n=1 Tax=bioreactor metagenome TaxID=1076179 RepID=A0A645H7Y4_9ZZZZ